MKDSAAKRDAEPAPPLVDRAISKPAVSIGEIFLEFLIIGATSFGGVVPYLRNALVSKKHWIDDEEFVEMLSISQSLPGLNATNMGVLTGEKLRGLWGSIAAIVGICLPGAVLMYIVGVLYRLHGGHVWATAGLKGVAAAAVGLLLSTVVQLSKKSLTGKFDFVFMMLTVIAVNRLHQSVLRTLIVVGILSILFHRPGRTQAAKDAHAAEKEKRRAA
jgi:chromate transporter